MMANTWQLKSALRKLRDPRVEEGSESLVLDEQDLRLAMSALVGEVGFQGHRVSQIPGDTFTVNGTLELVSFFAPPPIFKKYTIFKFVVKYT